MLKKTKPPIVDLPEIWNEVFEKRKEEAIKYIEFSFSINRSGKYYPYDKLQYKIPKELDKKLIWGLIKSDRIQRQIHTFSFGDDAELGAFVLTPNIQKALSDIDRNTTEAVLEWMVNNIGEQHYLKYLFNDLIEDEAISSSQLEGAATTMLEAKRLLKNKRKPRTADEKMILGNFKMMKFAWKNKDKPLSIDFIKKLHFIGVEDIDDALYSPGQYRTAADNVVVVDSDGDVVHTPPEAAGIEKRLQIVIDWINTSHDNADSDNYIHPLIKAIILHFSIGFEHPFKDGNGRVARALFYWFMFKNKYTAFRYITISTLLKAAPVKYGLSYIYTETDQMDLTYFIEYQCKIIVRAVEKFKAAYKDAHESRIQFESWMWESGLNRQLTERQRILLNVALKGIETDFSITKASENLGCAYNTAAEALNGLVALKIFKKAKVGREFTYSVLSRKSIMDNFSSFSDC